MNLSDVITDWKLEHGEEKTAKSGSTYHVIPQLQRKELLVTLVEILRERGLDSRLKFTKRVCQLIAEACVWVDAPDKARTRNKVSAIMKNDLPYALSEVFRDSERNAKVSDVDTTAEASEPAFTQQEIESASVPKVAPAKPAAGQLEDDPEADDEDPGMTEHAMKLMNKPFVAPKDGPKGLDNDLNLPLLAEIGIDPKEFGWTNE